MMMSQQEILKELWPEYCVPTKIYVFYFAMTVAVGLLQFMQFNRMVSEMKSGLKDPEDQKKASGVLMRASLGLALGGLVSLAVIVFAMNQLCKQGAVSDQILSGVLGFGAIVPIVTSLAMGVSLRLFVSEADLELLRRSQDHHVEKVLVAQAQQ